MIGGICRTARQFPRGEASLPTTRPRPTLQQSLLPREPPAHNAVDAAYGYRPADLAAGVGGDWFDVIPLSGARVALVMGDVVGHGVRAAATMGLARSPRPTAPTGTYRPIPPP